MEKLDFLNAIVCPTGLREGILENYLYLNMDKKYRSKKKIIESNYNWLSSIIYSNNPPFMTEKNTSKEFDLTTQNRSNFPQKIISTKVNKIK